MFRKGSFDEHFEQLERVLSAFKEADMTLKLSKCVFGDEKVPVIGHLVGPLRLFNLKLRRFNECQNRQLRS